ncbi:MAG: ComEA family DNA-binding protein [Clostridia bacterium]|nr:ComEA family DNA-binding protein [Clostridia bacterium]
MDVKEKKPELLLVALALVITVCVILYSVFDSPKYNSVEAKLIVASTNQSIDSSEIDNSKVNINTACVSELSGLELIGDKKAQAIIEYREKNGKFRAVEELTNVSGISESILYKNIGRITV